VQQGVDPVSIFNHILSRFLVGIQSGLHEEHDDGEFCFHFFVLESWEEGDAGPGLLVGRDGLRAKERKGGKQWSGWAGAIEAGRKKWAETTCA
jgi:hypothetical protein